MDLLGTSINPAIVAVVGVLLAWLARGRFDALDRRIDRLETRLVGTETRLDARIDRVESRLGSSIDGVESRLGSSIDGLESRFDGLESRFDRRFDALQSSMDAMRSDLTQVALAVGVRPRAQND
jgi:predicted nuclease with TOPRIM domain